LNSGTGLRARELIRALSLSVLITSSDRISKTCLKPQSLPKERSWDSLTEKRLTREEKWWGGWEINAEGRGLCVVNGLHTLKRCVRLYSPLQYSGRGGGGGPNGGKKIKKKGFKRGKRNLITYLGKRSERRDGIWPMLTLKAHLLPGKIT